MPLDPDAAVIKELMEGAWPPLESLPAAEGRRLVRQATEAGRAAGPPPPEMARVQDRTVPGPAGEIPVRIYWPEAGGAAPLPVLVYFHGGGFVICDLDSHDSICRQLATGAECAVVSVDYRLAPEHRYPAAVEDAYAATAWVAAHGAELEVDSSRIAVGGDSAGGNLTAVVALMARDRGGPPLCFQLLIYPVTDGWATRDIYPSREENGTGYFLTAEHMRWFWEQYMGAVEDSNDPYACPIRATDLSGLPPAMVITAGYDPLRDEGEAYGHRMADAGVPVEVLRYGGVFHGFFGLSAVVAAAAEAGAAAAEGLRSAFGRQKATA
ncbi:MAG: alpha/beta hydrolase [Acidimicrobiales bacterium]